MRCVPVPFLVPWLFVFAFALCLSFLLVMRQVLPPLADGQGGAGLFPRHCDVVLARRLRSRATPAEWALPDEGPGSRW